MIPSELPPRVVRLPAGERTIVVLTAGQLRHERFALRLRDEFGPLVVEWFRIDTPAGRTHPIRRRQWHPRRTARTLLGTVRHPSRMLAAASRAGARPSQAETEAALFGAEVDRLRSTSDLRALPVVDPNAPEFIARVAALDPYLVVTLGGPIYDPALAACARGLALNVHSGWCPQYRGSNTVEWALYHRDLNRLGATVHVLERSLDAGPILRRSTACVTADDTIESCFARAVAVGTELMCEVISEVIASDEITVFDQPSDLARTFVGRELTDDIRRLLHRDLANGMLRAELARLRRF